ncbi:hypothetical protein ERICIV_03424 [Paenibacillus larvae subsp. larvae]|uniref:Uncharacterized protein n=1 Tax=Paenibacillus larvae subsp. larvae TaxID=147375 RepID=A0A2L1U4E5_9BACL|nr:hypothetical protein ERICIII_03681 [Paenibacillus larvae subsp. larvae]AVF32293.1 hypothetical protein ERICIV_03424 [Paenibacillus larvae subsp. larvae]
MIVFSLARYSRTSMEFFLCLPVHELFTWNEEAKELLEKEGELIGQRV